MPCLKRLPQTARATLVASAIALLAVACGGASGADEEVGASSDELRVTSSFTSRGTGYYPSSSALEGGFNDRLGKKLRTLQSFLAGSAPYVSVAMDSSAFKYGTRLRIKELDAKYGKAIIFRVVDTGGAFRGKGRSRIDVCVANRSASVDKTINGTLHIDVLDETSGPAEDATPDEAPDGDGAGGGGGAAPPGASAGSGRACSGDGSCNPGNDGSGEICTAGRCVSGCRTRAQCPGTKSCVSGQCE